MRKSNPKESKPVVTLPIPKAEQQRFKTPVTKKVITSDIEDTPVGTTTKEHLHQVRKVLLRVSCSTISLPAQLLKQWFKSTWFFFKQ
jgi:hypothetical protein